MEELNALWIIIGIGVLILSAGLFWGTMQTTVKAIKESTAKSEEAIGKRIDDLADTWEKNHEDTRLWLKSLQSKTEINETDIAILKDRQERET